MTRRVIPFLKRDLTAMSWVASATIVWRVMAGRELLERAPAVPLLEGIIAVPFAWCTWFIVVSFLTPRKEQSGTPTVSSRTPTTVHGSAAETASNLGEPSPDASPDDPEVSACVIAIMALPLTDEEKAEAVRRLMSDR